MKKLLLLSLFGVSLLNGMDSPFIRSFSPEIRKKIEKFSTITTRNPIPPMVILTLTTGEERGLTQRLIGYINPIEKSDFGETVKLLISEKDDTSQLIFPSDLITIEILRSKSASPPSSPKPKARKRSSSAHD